MGEFAKGTRVPVSKSKAEVMDLLAKYGAERTAVGEEPGRAVVSFELKGRRVIFSMFLPKADDASFQFAGRRRRTAAEARAAWEQECREGWRTMLLGLKAKFVSIASGLMTFEQEFLFFMATPGGGVLGDHALPALNQAYKTGKLPPLLPSGVPEVDRG